MKMQKNRITYVLHFLTNMVFFCTFVLSTLLLSNRITVMANTIPKSSEAQPYSALSDFVDAVYLMGLKHCEERRRRIRQWAISQNISYIEFNSVSYKDFSLYLPPIPIANVPEEDSVSAGQVACTASHVQIWRQAVERNYSRIIVLEDDVRMTNNLIERFGQLMHDAKQGSIRNGVPWHYIYLRFHPTKFWNGPNQAEKWHGALDIALPGWGTAAYVASYDGIRFLLSTITKYSYPLDVQISRLQEGKDTRGKRFVALHACQVDHHSNSVPGCPENIHELSREERGNCHYSASLAGDVLRGSRFPGALKTGE